MKFSAFVAEKIRDKTFFSTQRQIARQSGISSASVI